MGTWTSLINQKFGTLIVRKYIGDSKWKCECTKCGNIIIAKTSTLHNIVKLNRDGCKHVKPVEIGNKYGYLTVINSAEDYIKPKSGRHERQWLCKCQCGREKIILEDNLKSLKSTSCGKCSNRISIPEKTIYYYLSKYFKDIQENYRPKFLSGKEIDLYIPSLSIGIEYDGERWHKNLNLDLEKDKMCHEHNITLIRIREPKCPISDKFKYLIITPKPTTNATHMTIPIKKLINILNSNFCTAIDFDIDCLRDNADICKSIISTKGFNSLENEFPDIAKEWDYEKNGSLTPNDVSAHSGKKAWWICPKGHSYSSVIASRTGIEKCGCPICSNKGANIYLQGKYIGEHSLLRENPSIAQEFDIKKNKMSPNEISFASNKKVWWKCKACGYEWQAKVNNRTSSLHTGCPNCAKKANKQLSTRRENIKKSNKNLLTMFPKLCEEWDYEKNNISPMEVTCGSGMKVWWKCPKGHSYQASISHRTSNKPTGCPYCKNPSKHKKIVQYTLSGEKIKIWSNAKEVASVLNVRTNSITRCCRGERKTAHGYVWKYLNNQK